MNDRLTKIRLKVNHIFFKITRDLSCFFPFWQLFHLISYVLLSLILLNVSILLFMTKGVDKASESKMYIDSNYLFVF